MDQLTTAVVTIAVAIVGVATLAVLVSRNANTSGVIASAGDAFSGALQAATGPVSGGFSGSIPTYGFGHGYQLQ